MEFGLDKGVIPFWNPPSAHRYTVLVTYIYIYDSLQHKDMNVDFD